MGALDTHSDIRTLVNGTVRAGALDFETGKVIDFNPFVTVDTREDAITVGADHGYETGDRISYSAGDGWPIDGLKRNGNYYAIVDEEDPTRILLAASREDANSGIAVDLIDNPQFETSKGSTIAFTLVDDVENIVEFQFAHGIAAGDSLVYTAADHKPVGGLIDGTTYYAVLVDGHDTQLQLATDSAGTNIVDLDTSPFFTTDDERNLAVLSADDGTGIITFADDHGLLDGDRLTYHERLGFELSGGTFKHPWRTLNDGDVLLRGDTD